MLVEVLKAEVWDESAEDLAALMEADNLDQQTSMADHEAHVVEKIHASLSTVRPKPRECLWEAIWRMSEGKLGGYSKDDCAQCFNFAKTLSRQHLELLRSFHFHFVNPSVLRVEPKIFVCMAALPDECPLSRVALACWSYMVPPERYISCG